MDTKELKNELARLKKIEMSDSSPIVRESARAKAIAVRKALYNKRKGERVQSTVSL